MIHVICLKFGIKYPSEYVNKLFRGVRRNTSKEFSFTCFTDAVQGITHPEIQIEGLPFYTTDWYSKIGLYNQDLYNPDDQIFYFDLDTIIVSNLDELFDYKGDFILLRDFYRPKGFGSGLMSWRPAAVNHMWTNFTQGYKSRFGDQGWCEEQYPTADIWQNTYPEKVISYKVHILNQPRHGKHTNHGGSLKTASIVCFHGKPNPHNIVREKWVQEHWV